MTTDVEIWMGYGCSKHFVVGNVTNPIEFASLRFGDEAIVRTNGDVV